MSSSSHGLRRINVRRFADSLRWLGVAAVGSISLLRGKKILASLIGKQKRKEQQLVGSDYDAEFFGVLAKIIRIKNWITRNRGFQRLRRSILFRSRRGNITYLDHAGAALYHEQDVRTFHAQVLAREVLGNPHSAHSTTLSEFASRSAGEVGGARSAAIVDEARRFVLSFVGASHDYVCVFTAGATDGMRAVADAFPWLAGESRLVHVDEVHASLLGICAPARRYGARVSAAHVVADGAGGWRAELGDDGGDVNVDTAGPHLFVLPAECNVTGERYPTACVAPPPNLARRGSMQRGGEGAWGRNDDDNDGIDDNDSSGWYVLLDASKYVATSPLRLAEQFPHADFVVLSFYKIFGYPTGLGALICSPRGARALSRGAREDGRFRGGGSVHWRADATAVPRGLPDGIEDGTDHFLGIASLKYMGRRLLRMGYDSDDEAVHFHTQRLARSFANGLRSMRHADGSPVAELYGAAWQSHPNAVSTDLRQHANGASVAGVGGQGGVVAFNLLLPRSRWKGARRHVGHAEAEGVLASAGVIVRSGQHCNPRAVLRVLHDAEQARFESVERRGEDDVVADRRLCWGGWGAAGAGLAPDGSPTGVLRASFGLASTNADVHRALLVIRRAFAAVDGPEARNLVARPSWLSGERAEEEHRTRISALCVYPLKGAGGWLISHSGETWPIDHGGKLAGDRELCIVDGSSTSVSRVITQRDCPCLAAVRVKKLEVLSGGRRRAHLACPGWAGRGGRIDVTWAAPEMGGDNGSTFSSGISAIACGTEVRVRAVGSGPEATEAFCRRATGGRRGCFLACLLSRDEDDSGGGGNDTSVTRSLANEAPLLLLGRSAAVAAAQYAGVVSKYAPNSSIPVEVLAHFRWNVLVEGEPHSFAEDKWIGSDVAVLRRSRSPPDPSFESPTSEPSPDPLEYDEICKLNITASCDRCPVVNVDQRNGRILPSQPLISLGRVRRGAVAGSRGVPVGVLASAIVPYGIIDDATRNNGLWGEGPARLQIGDSLHVRTRTA
ncbi:molybdenum cofactor sulfurase [Pycnococcus provasolii]